MTQVINARVTYRKSPIHILERFTFKDIDSAYSSIKQHSGMKECVIVQTCNRVELFCTGDMHDIDSMKKTWASIAGLEERIFVENLELSHGSQVYDHLLKLASGLDSLVVGEEQILGQIKNSITVARKFHASGRILNTLFDKAVHVGSRVRNSTGINRGSISIGSMAVKLTEENIDNLASKRILLIGTGEAASLVAKSLNKRGYKFFVASRTLERSKSFSVTAGGTPLNFENVLKGFDEFDVLFVATKAPYFLVTYDRIKEAMNKRKTGMMILDLSNPRTVDEKIATIGSIKMMNLDQIAEMVDKNMKNRIGQVTSAEKIINEEIIVVDAAMKRLEAEPIVKEVFKEVEQVREKELRKALQMLKETDEEKIKIINDLTKAVVEGIISAPMNNLRKASEQGDSEILKTANKLFSYKKKE